MVILNLAPRSMCFFCVVFFGGEGYEWRPAEMNPGDFHTFDVSAQFLFVGCSDGRILRLELETGEERYSNDLGGGGVKENVISRSGETSEKSLISVEARKSNSESQS